MNIERLKLTEACFCGGQQMLLSGQTSDPRKMFQRTVEIKATPYREHALAEMELKRVATKP